MKYRCKKEYTWQLQSSAALLRRKTELKPEPLDTLSPIFAGEKVCGGSYALATVFR